MATSALDRLLFRAILAPIAAGCVRPGWEWSPCLRGNALRDKFVIDASDRPDDSLGALNRSVRIFIAVLGCLHLCGGHWGVMQLVAWSNMIIDYSSRDGIVEGAKKTFDGEHPCCMCKAIAEGKKESGAPDNKPLQGSQGLVLKECVLTPVVRLSPPVALDRVVLSVPDFARHARSLGHRPPVPPPRLA